MNKKEREQLRIAIEYITTDDRFVDGLDMLYRLAGYGEHPTVRMRREARGRDIDALPQNQTMRFPKDRD